jgi:hypothetical protein
MSENSGEMPSPDSLKLEINAGKIGVEPHSQASMIGESKIETLETQRAKRMRRLGGVRGKLVAAGLGVVVGASGMGILSNKDSHAVDTNGQDNRSSAGDTVIANNESDQTPIPTANEAPETERSIYEKEIEDKYGIELLNQREGYERIGKEYDEENEELMGHRPVVRWSMNQLINIDEAISQFPPDFFPEVDGKKFAISLWDYPESENWGGLAHWPHNMISLGENTFESGTNLGTLAHEGAHIKDLLVNNGDLGKKVTEIIGYDSFKDARLYFKPILEEYYANKLINSDTYHELNYGFMGYEGRGIDDPVEFIAVLASKYTKGLEEFNDLIKLFGEERTRDLYDFIKKEVFNGREYGEAVKRKEVAARLFSKHGTSIIDISDNRISIENLEKIESILEVFPNEFYKTIDGQGLSIIIDNKPHKKIHDGYRVVLSGEDFRDPEQFDVIDAVDCITHSLMHRINELSGYEYQEKLLEIIGGEDFLKNPEKLYPNLFTVNGNPKFEETRLKFFTKKGKLKNVEEMLAIIGEEYISGSGAYWLEELFEKENLTYPTGVSREEKDRIFSSSTHGKIYNLFKDDIFSGKQVWS